MEAAVRTASEDKRHLLAQAATAALTGNAAAEIDQLQLLLRTVMDLDPPHVALLALIARLEQEDQRSPYPGERRADRAAMEAEWQGPRDLMDAALATLDGATLIESVVDYNGAERGGSCSLTACG